LDAALARSSACANPTNPSLAASLFFVAHTTGANAPAGYYSVNSDGSVYAAKTGLTWQQPVSGYSYSVAAAQTYCASITLNGVKARVPTIKELLTLVDLSQTSGAYIDSTFFPGTPNVQFWSNTPVAGVTGNNWYIPFWGGFTDYGPVGDSNYVRCVR
jgi:hypothetical protein